MLQILLDLDHLPVPLNATDNSVLTDIRVYTQIYSPLTLMIRITIRFYCEKLESVSVKYLWNTL